MQTKIKPVKVLKINLYSFDQLSNEAKEKAITRWYELEDYPMLEDDMNEQLKELLEGAKVGFENTKVLYSLSWSQGDGVCFTGEITKDGKTLRLTHSARYYYATSVIMDWIDAEGEDMDEDSELKEIYIDVCRKLEKIGYSILEYRMNDNEFNELCQANEYTFTIDGVMNNG